MNITDLRRPAESQERTGERWSQWSSLPLIEMSALETYRFVKAMIPGPHQRILEVGCGNGYLSLELARDGHRVVGLDQSARILAVAEQTRKAHPQIPEAGRLDYVCAEIGTWQMADGSFEVVVINRALHHLHDLPAALARIRCLLAPGGRLICQDYAYDRLDLPTASWVYAMQRLFFLCGLSDDNPATTAHEISSGEAFYATWLEKAEKREHPLNRYEAMMQALQAHFHQHYVSWVPYLFVYLGNGLRPVPQEQERALITFLREREQQLIDLGSIQAVGFRYAGLVPAA